MNFLGIDIGGSAIKAAVVEMSTGRLLYEPEKIETPGLLAPDEMANVIARLVRKLHWQRPLGVGFPGVINGSRILTSDNLHKGFIGRDGVRLFSRATGLPVSLINDAAAAGLAEMTFGAGCGFNGKVLMLTFGTGVGSVLFGHGVLFPCELGQLPLDGKPAEKHVASSVRSAQGLSWEKWGGRLNDYIRILETIHWPELIIIGGGVSAEHRRFFRYIQPRAKIVPAEFFNNAGIVGAALWARRNASSGSKIKTF